jgi:hypothetical protein
MCGRRAAMSPLARRHDPVGSKRPLDGPPYSGGHGVGAMRERPMRAWDEPAPMCRGTRREPRRPGRRASRRADPAGSSPPRRRKISCRRRLADPHARRAPPATWWVFRSPRRAGRRGRRSRPRRPRRRRSGCAGCRRRRRTCGCSSRSESRLEPAAGGHRVGADVVERDGGGNEIARFESAGVGELHWMVS